MPDHEGLIRAVAEGLGLDPEGVRKASEANIAAHIASATAAYPNCCVRCNRSWWRRLLGL